MSERKKNQLVFNRIKVLSSKKQKDYASEMMSHPYSEEEGWGYTDVLQIDGSINATLQKRISTYYNVWNDELQQVERQCFQIVAEIPFELDLNRFILMAEGTNIQLNRVKQSFRQVFWNEFVYEDINLMPVDYINMLQKSGKLLAIGELTINDFLYEGCLIGRYNAKPTSQINIIEKFGEHVRRIIRAKLKIDLVGEECILCVSNKNVMTLESTVDAKVELVNYMKAYLV